MQCRLIKEFPERLANDCLEKRFSSVMTEDPVLRWRTKRRDQGHRQAPLLLSPLRNPVQLRELAQVILPVSPIPFGARLGSVAPHETVDDRRRLEHLFDILGRTVIPKMILQAVGGIFGIVNVAIDVILSFTFMETALVERVIGAFSKMIHPFLDLFQ